MIQTLANACPVSERKGNFSRVCMAHQPRQRRQSDRNIPLIRPILQHRSLEMSWELSRHGSECHDSAGIGSHRRGWRLTLVGHHFGHDSRPVHRMRAICSSSVAGSREAIYACLSCYMPCAAGEGPLFSASPLGHRLSDYLTVSVRDA